MTALLPAAVQGDRNAQDELFRLVEPELRQLAWHWLRRYSAQERVQVTDLLNHVFLKLMKVESPDWSHRGQFYFFACRNLPRVLIDLLRKQDRHKKREHSEDVHVILDEAPSRQIGLSEASVNSLKEAIASLDEELTPLHRRILELKYFGELTLDAIAEITSLDRSKVDRMLRVAKECLRDRLRNSFPEFGVPR